MGHPPRQDSVLIELYCPREIAWGTRRSQEKQGDGNEFKDIISGGAFPSGSLTQWFSLYPTEDYNPPAPIVDGKPKFDVCRRPPMEDRVLDLKYPAQNGHEKRTIEIQENSFTPPVSVRGKVSILSDTWTEWILNHPVPRTFCEVAN